MISFLISIAALVLGYLIYGRVIERIFGPDDRKTPALAHPDGVDYIAMPTWKVFMIQFLNIAGTGPIFGAIMGAWFGPASYLWIVLGCIFAGSVHDYLSGMMSLRHDGASLPELIGKYLGKAMRIIMLIFSMLLLLMVGAVFVYSPALILAGIGGNEKMWFIIIFGYYIIATLLPIDKIIGKIYPVFAAALIFMAIGLFVCLIIKMPAIPEIWNISSMDTWMTAQTHNGTDLLGMKAYLTKNTLFPAMFITIACGAISGFHATQSPLMARCLKSEKLGRPVFYGSMITEGFVALVWAAVSSWFFYSSGWRDVLPQDAVNEFLAQVGNTDGKTLIQYFNPPAVVKLVCSSWLGIVGGILAMLGVVAAPITSGDTALRSARLIIADFLKFDQKPIAKRLMIAVPMFAAVILLLIWQQANPNGFNVLWQYFGWSNQTLSVFTLWTITIFLHKYKKCYWVTLIPAIFMTVVSATFIIQQIIG
ncbi:MAG: carbon starvation protein A [Muribaculaceae bacterium]|nr:carbon starvation protein A [Muribaculaceae bacterium]